MMRAYIWWCMFSKGCKVADSGHFILHICLQNMHHKVNYVWFWRQQIFWKHDNARITRRFKNIPCKCRDSCGKIFAAFLGKKTQSGLLASVKSKSRFSSDFHEMCRRNTLMNIWIERDGSRNPSNLNTFSLLQPGHRVKCTSADLHSQYSLQQYKLRTCRSAHALEKICPAILYLLGSLSSWMPIVLATAISTFCLLVAIISLASCKHAEYMNMYPCKNQKHCATTHAIWTHTRLWRNTLYSMS